MQENGGSTVRNAQIRSMGHWISTAQRNARSNSTIQLRLLECVERFGTASKHATAAFWNEGIKILFSIIDNFVLSDL